MTSVITGPGYKNTFRLKDLLGRERVRLLRSGDHPLGPGFAAIETWFARGATLSSSEREHAADVELFAKELFALEADWRDREQTLRGQILKASECAAIRFEFHVSTFSLRPCSGGVNWTRYRSGLGDFQTRAPNLIIECKLIRKDDLSDGDNVDVRDRILRKARSSKSQSRPPESPYVLAIGFEDTFDDSQADEVVDAVRRSDQWFAQHREVSALLIFTPHKPIGQSFQALGMVGRPTHFGAITQVTNNGAAYPIPQGLLLRPEGPMNTEVLQRIDSLGRKGTAQFTQVLPLRRS